MGTAILLMVIAILVFLLLFVTTKFFMVSRAQKDIINEQSETIEALWEELGRN